MNHSQSLQNNGWLPIFRWPRAQNKNTAQFDFTDWTQYLAFCAVFPHFKSYCCSTQTCQRRSWTANLGWLPERQLASPSSTPSSPPLSTSSTSSVIGSPASMISASKIASFSLGLILFFLESPKKMTLNPGLRVWSSSPCAFHTAPFPTASSSPSATARFFTGTRSAAPLATGWRESPSSPNLSRPSTLTPQHTPASLPLL